MEWNGLRWSVCQRFQRDGRALSTHLLSAAAAAAAAAAGPPVWAGGGTAVPPGRRQQGRWLRERREGTLIQTTRGNATTKKEILFSRMLKAHLCNAACPCKPAVEGPGQDFGL